MDDLLASLAAADAERLRKIAMHAEAIAEIEGRMPIGFGAWCMRERGETPGSHARAALDCVSAALAELAADPSFASLEEGVEPPQERNEKARRAAAADRSAGPVADRSIRR